MEKRSRLVGVSIAVLIVIAIGYFIVRTWYPTYPGRHRLQCRIRSVPVSVDMTGADAQRIWIAADGRGLGTGKNLPTDREGFFYEIHLLLLVEESDGLLRPIVYREMAPHYGLFNVYRWPRLREASGSLDQFSSETTMPLPTSSRIKKLVIVIREKEPDARRWRVLSLEPAALSDALEKGLKIPRISALPLLEGHPQESRIRTAYRLALEEPGAVVDDRIGDIAQKK